MSLSKPIVSHILIIQLLGLLICGQSNATHLRAGEIVAVRANCSSLTFEITVTVYIDMETGVQFGGPGEFLRFGDGSRIEVPLTETIPRPDLGINMGIASFQISHTYGGPGPYYITYEEANRNANILNIQNSVETRFFLITSINIDPFLGCSSTPQLLVPPIDKSCTGAAWLHNPGAFDPDGDSLSYELVTPKGDKGLDVFNYRNPNAREFYDRIGLTYNTASENGKNPPSFSIDPISGTISWDAPGAPGEYNIAFIIKEWRKIADVWILLGFVTRDMQIIVEDCMNQRPRLDVPPDICVEAGEKIEVEVKAFDPDNHEIKIEVFSQAFSVNPSPPDYLPSPAVFQSSPGKLLFTWQTVCEHVKDQAYQVVFKVTDKPLVGPALVDFETWNIRVVGPAPKWVSATANVTNRSADLAWEPYVCSNAISLQLWRRVDHFDYTSPECITGMPAFLGFTKINEGPISLTTYTDTNNGQGLAVGAVYCYRMVAVFPLPGGGESYVSKDICLPPIKADAPVITHVTVDKTDRTDGTIRVRWRSPFDLDQTQFPKPYSYEVYRAEGFSGKINLAKPHPGRISDSVFVDKGINTEELIYNYRIVGYDRNGVQIDTSRAASSVRLEVLSGIKQIELKWAADVPWSIQTQSYPRHLIYRGSEGATEDQLILIDSVNVNEKKMRYLDEGAYQDTPLKENEKYCYRVLTRGAYGNPNIEEPLLNYSQIICTAPGDTVAPCVPIVKTMAIDCDQFAQNNPCQVRNYSNTLKWLRPVDAACRADSRSYKVYATAAAGGTYSLIAENLRDTFYIDSNLASYARCYKVSAIDQSGNESELSEEFCFDNCPYYELPNVFTPEGDGCNDLFSAWGYNENNPCGQQDKTKCARFVKKVEFVVYNRWGKEVYQYTSAKEKSIYINWDGRDNAGHLLNGGVYYYKATVFFTTSNPANEVKTIKSWVHLVLEN